MKKIILQGLIAGAILLVLSIAGLYFIMWLIPDMAMEYFGQAFISETWRNVFYYVHPFVIGTALSWLWNRLQNKAGKSLIGRSLKFGLVYITIATFPYMLLIYSAINVSLPIIVTWLLFGFAEAVISAIIFHKLNKHAKRIENYPGTDHSAE